MAETRDDLTALDSYDDSEDNDVEDWSAGTVKYFNYTDDQASSYTPLDEYESSDEAQGASSIRVGRSCSS
jgi:hypothetical protein